MNLGLDVVVHKTATDQNTNLTILFDNFMDEVLQSRPQIIVGLPRDPDVSAQLLRALSAANIIRGWDCPSSSSSSSSPPPPLTTPPTTTPPNPCVVESSFLQLLILSSASSPRFLSSAST
eukprot:3685858-Rhodomonas_salina.1